MILTTDSCCRANEAWFVWRVNSCCCSQPPQSTISRGYMSSHCSAHTPPCLSKPLNGYFLCSSFCSRMVAILYDLWMNFMASSLLKVSCHTVCCPMNSRQFCCFFLSKTPQFEIARKSIQMARSEMLSVSVHVVMCSMAWLVVMTTCLCCLQRSWAGRLRRGSTYETNPHKRCKCSCVKHNVIRN